jgi:2-desacetyl-2-hydroxyethyl bacteriochlorophyllide A dehydrogenase
MRALTLRFQAPRRVEIHDLALPTPAEGELLIRTLYSGISAGTEMLAYRGELDPDLPLDETIGALGGTFRYPFAYGYSVVGTVGRGAGPIAEGTLVFLFHPHASLCTARPEDVVVVEGIDPRSATLFPLVETALQISLDAGEVKDEDIVVVGGGVVGTLAAALLKDAGGRVLGVEPLPWKREAAAAFGIQSIPPEDVQSVVTERTEGRGVRLVVEASGNPTALGASLSLLAHEGTALVCSWFGNKSVPLPLGGAFHRRRLTIRSSQVSTIPSRLQPEWSKERRRKAVVRLMRTLPLDELATHTFPIEDAQRAFASIDAVEEGLIHVALSYGAPD